MDAKCTARNRAGEPCGAQAWRDGLCRWHHLGLEVERATWRRTGGEQRSNKQRARRQLPDAVLTPAELQGFIGLALRGVIAGEIEPGVANAVATLARAAVVVREATELEDRLAALEATADGQDGQNGQNGRFA